MSVSKRVSIADRMQKQSVTGNEVEITKGKGADIYFNNTSDVTSSITNNVTDDIVSDTTSDVSCDNTSDNVSDITSDTESYIQSDIMKSLTKSSKYTDTHIRKTYYFDKNLYKKLDKISKKLNKDHSYIVNEALKLLFNMIENKNKE